MMKFDGARTSVHRLHESRANARSQVFRAWDKLEAAIVEALAGEPLRGLPNLGKSNEPLKAIRVYGMGSLFAHEGWQLVILRTGHTAMARRTEPGSVEWRRFSSEERRIEDFEPYLNALKAALSTHVERVEKTTRNYDRMSSLAQNFIAFMRL